MEYRVSLCSPSHPDLQEKLQFKVIEEVRKGVWKENTIEIDSTYEDENFEEVTVKVTKTQRKRI